MVARAKAAAAPNIAQAERKRVENDLRARPVTPAAPEWIRFLERLPTLGIALPHADHVRELWSRLSRAIPVLASALPSAGPTSDGMIQFAWDRQRHHLDLDISADGTIDWFYLDRDTGTTDSGQEPINISPSARLHSYLAAYFCAP